MPDPIKKPIIVNSKNDPRYRAYQDSLTMYNSYIRNPTDKWLNSVKKDNKGRVSEKDWENFSNRNKATPIQNDKDWKAFNSLTKLNHKEPGKKLPFKQALGTQSFDTYVSVFKKPTQPVVFNETLTKPQSTKKEKYNYDVGYRGLKEYVDVIKPREKITAIENYLTPQEIQKTNQTLNTDLPQIKQVTQQPKYYNVTDKVNQNFGGSETSYKWYPENGVPLQELSNQKYDDGTPYNSRKLTPQYALGGNLNNNMQNNKLTEFNEGGSHESSPLGGVPLGPNASVEQGETKSKNYIYSDRLSIDENMTKQMNLPFYIKGKTFADASKAINNKFLDRSDKYSSETKNTLLKRLEQAQETLKAQEQQRAEQLAQSMQSNQQQVPDMMNGQVPEGMEEFTESQDNPQEEKLEQFQMAYGGRIKYEDGGNLVNTNYLTPKGITPFSTPALQSNITDASGLNKTPMPIKDVASPGLSGYLGAATTSYDLFNLAKGQGASTNGFTNTLGGITKGATAGAAFGPIGAGVGAVVGGVAGAFGTAKAKEAQNHQFGVKAHNYGQQFADKEMAYGGRIKYGDGGNFKLKNTLNPYSSPYMSKITDMYKPNNGEPDEVDLTGLKPNTMFYNPEKTSFEKGLQITDGVLPNENKLDFSKIDSVQKPGTLFGRGQRATREYLDKNGGKFLKYAPVAMNAYQLANLSKPDNKLLQRLGDRYNPKYVDESKLQNIADQELNNNINAYSQMGGSQGATRNAILASGLNKTKALSEAYMKANELNTAQDNKAQSFNLEVNQFNAQTQHKESEQHERNAAAYRNEKSKYLASIGTDLGEIGKEEVNKNQIAEALGYSWDGKHMVDKKTGEKITVEEAVKKANTDKKEYKFKDKSSEFGKISYNPTKHKF